MYDFSESDRLQPLFKRLKVALEERLQKLREQNDMKKDVEDTAHVRGQIHEIKSLLSAMSEEPTSIKPQRRSHY